MRAALLAALLLAGCAHRPATPVALPVPCRSPSVTPPDFAFDQLPRGADIFTQVKTLLADRKQRIAYERELVAANEACR